MKKIILLLTMMLFLTGLSGLSVYANEGDGEPGEIIMIAVPDSNGRLMYYTGNEAKEEYKRLTQQSDINADTEFIYDDIDEPDSSIESEAGPYGPFHYRYRFKLKSRGTRYGVQKRISNYLENRTTEKQQMTIGINATTSWSINASLTGKFKEVFNAAVGASWQDSSTISQTLVINVAPKSRVWMEFRPRLRYVSGRTEKYYIPRGPISKRPVVVESKAVYSTSPRTIIVQLDTGSFRGTDGAYVWKQRRLG